MKKIRPATPDLRTAIPDRRREGFPGEIAAAPDRIDVVIPVYNEGKNILRVLEAFEREVITPIRLPI